MHKLKHHHNFNHKFEMDMCSGNLFKKIVIFSLPLMLMGILQLLYNAADLIVVSNFSDDPEALGAVGSTATLINLCVNLFMGLSVGTNVLVAKIYGAKEFNKLSDVVHTSILTSLIIGVALGTFGYIFAKDLLHLMSNDLDLSRIYLQIYFLGMPFNLLYNFASAVLRAVGDTQRPLFFLIISGAINVVLNLIFCIVFKMSVRGVAIATVISQIISCLLIMITLYRTKEAYQFRFKKLKLNRKILFEMFKIGIPAGISSTIFSLSNTIVQSSVNKFGVVAMNGNSAAISIEGFVYTSMNSVYHAALAFASQNYGAKNSKNIKKVTIYSLIFVTIVALSFGLTLFTLGRSIIRVYTQDPESIEVAYIRLHYLTLPYFLCGIMDVMVGILRGIGYSILPMLVSIIGVCGIRIAWIYLVFYNLTDFIELTDLNYLYLSYPITWTITFLIQLLCYFITSRKVYPRLDKELQEQTQTTLQTA